ncbi:hypothetical protein B9Z55_028196 [Caenorhabditis nigoni]|uniref:Uncharacterized protein n=1 Tax=Caenorhabditis nigoni TaxID=1611254 RepID=A0A2G5SCT3_9PELO|nr:hypothetical protein B9Z55_028196 [Caenorhabditis nigoni]
MKLIRKYHVIPYEGTLLDSAKRFLESILAAPTLDDTTKCRFYQDVLYRIKSHPEMNIATEETVDIVRENLRIHQPPARVEEGAISPTPPAPDQEDADLFKFGENYAENESGPLKHVKQHHRFDPYGKPPQPLIDQTLAPPQPQPPKIQKTATKRHHIGDYDDDEPERKKYATPRKRKTNPFKKLIKKKKKKTFNFMKPNLKRKQQRVDKKQKQQRVAEIKTEIKTEEEPSAEHDPSKYDPSKHDAKYKPSNAKHTVKYEPYKVKKEVKHDPSKVKHEYDPSKVKKEVKHEYDPSKVKKEPKHEYDLSKVKKEVKHEYDPSKVKHEYDLSKVKKEVKHKYDPSKVKKEYDPAKVKKEVKHDPSKVKLESNIKHENLKRKIPADPEDEPWHKSRLIEESFKKKKTKKTKKSKIPSNKRKLSSTSPYENVAKRRSLHGSGPAPPAGSRIYCRLWKF